MSSKLALPQRTSAVDICATPSSTLLGYKFPSITDHVPLYNKSLSLCFNNACVVERLLLRGGGGVPKNKHQRGGGHKRKRSGFLG